MAKDAAAAKEFHGEYCSHRCFHNYSTCLYYSFDSILYSCSAVAANGRKVRSDKKGAKKTPGTEPKQSRRRSGSTAGAATTGKKRRRGRRSASSEDEDEESEDEDNEFLEGADDRYNALYADDSAEEPEPEIPASSRKRVRESRPSERAHPPKKKAAGRGRKSVSRESDEEEDVPPPQSKKSGRAKPDYDDSDMEFDEDDDVDPYAAAASSKSTML